MLKGDKEKKCQCVFNTQLIIMPNIADAQLYYYPHKNLQLNLSCFTNKIIIL